MLFRLLLLCFCLFSTYLAEAKPPALSSRDARIKIEEILKAHVSHQALTPELVKRSIENYLEEVDPAKTYFIESDIAKWINPSNELLAKTLEGYKKEDFSTFEAIHDTFLQAVERRGRLEEQVLSKPLPSGVLHTEFKDLEWAKSENELYTRLARIRSLQIETSEKLNQESKDKFIDRMAKRRSNREHELTGQNATEKRQIVLSYVLKSTTSALDSQTSYFTPTEANQFLIQVQQRLFGIGAQLRDDLSGLTIIRLIEEGPASRSKKLRINDRIIAVNGEPIVGMDITESVELIRGQQGTAVQLTILRPIVGSVGEGESKTEEKLDVKSCAERSF